VGGENDGLGAAHFPDEVPDHVLLVGVETVGRFVENEDFGVVDDGLSEAGAVAVAFGEGIDGLAPYLLEESGIDGAVDGLGFGGP
jgi:hypothetical protein